MMHGPCESVGQKRLDLCFHFAKKYAISFGGAARFIGGGVHYRRTIFRCGLFCINMYGLLNRGISVLDMSHC